MDIMELTVFICVSTPAEFSLGISRKNYYYYRINDSVQLYNCDVVVSFPFKAHSFCIDIISPCATIPRQLGQNCTVAELAFAHKTDQFFFYWRSIVTTLTSWCGMKTIGCVTLLRNIETTLCYAISFLFSVPSEIPITAFYLSHDTRESRVVFGESKMKFSLRGLTLLFRPSHSYFPFLRCLRKFTVLNMILDNQWNISFADGEEVRERRVERYFFLCLFFLPQWFRRFTYRNNVIPRSEYKNNQFIETFYSF